MCCFLCIVPLVYSFFFVYLRGLIYYRILSYVPQRCSILAYTTSFQMTHSKRNNIDFKLLSFNVRGIRSSTKRKALFTWLSERKYDIIFLQETYSTAEVEDIWKTQWRGKLHFAQGSNRSCRVMILVRSDLDLDLKSVKCDDEGRWIIMEAEVQGSLFLFVNIYAPNKIQEQCSFFDNLNKDIEDCVVNIY